MSDVLHAKLSVAPMIDWTHVHFRYLMRLLSPTALLYTEMQTVGAIFHNPDRALARHPDECPVALQLGGSDPEKLARAAKLGEVAGFDEINLNLGCPSDKVQAGQFGACLMRDKGRVSECIRAMAEVVSIPVTAKTRIGIDEDDSYAFFQDFVGMLVDSGIKKLIVHARKAWLHGLNPKQNRTIPPLHPDYAWRIREAIAPIPVVINGNITTVDTTREHLQHVDGVMVGRLVCQHPWGLALLHQSLNPQWCMPRRSEVAAAYITYLLTSPLATDVPRGVLLKPIMNLAHGLPEAKGWKAAIMELRGGGFADGLYAALRVMEELEGLKTVL